MAAAASTSALKYGPKSPESIIYSKAVELIPKRFIFLHCNALYPRRFRNMDFFSTDDLLLYRAFYKDFGPPNVSHLYLYIQMLLRKLADPALKDHVIVHYTLCNPEALLNAAVLAGQFCIIVRRHKPHEVLAKMESLYSFREFCDATSTKDEYTIRLKDMYLVAAKIRDCGLFDFNDFNYDDYVYYENVQNGDMNWILPAKILAFAGPHYKTKPSPKAAEENDHPIQTPESYIPYFKAFGISTIVRLNSACYKSAVFTEAGFTHHDIVFNDGSTPTRMQWQLFCKIVEEAPGAVAVHCRAGLGRTGTMICVYLIKKYSFSYREAIAWCRMCRPASVVGEQQTWLMAQQFTLWNFGAYATPPIHTQGIYSYGLVTSYLWDKQRQGTVPERPIQAVLDFEAKLRKKESFKTGYCQKRDCHPRRILHPSRRETTPGTPSDSESEADDSEEALIRLFGDAKDSKRMIHEQGL